MRLDWDTPSQQQQASVACPPRRYVVRVKHRGTSRARAWRYDRSTRSAVIGGLRPDTAYQFRLIVDTECLVGTKAAAAAGGHQVKSGGRGGLVGRWIFARTAPSTESAGRVAKSVGGKASTGNSE